MNFLQITEAIKSCNELKGDDDCGTIHKRFKCFFENVPEFKVHKPDH